MRYISKIINGFLEALEYNNSNCPSCGRVIFFSENALCSHCEGKLFKVNKRCISCAEDKEADSYPFCNKCRNENYSFDGGACVYKYDDISARVVWSFKFRKNYNATKYAAKKMCEILDITSWLKEIDIITCVPSTEEKLLERGYNQAELISNEISKKYDIINNKNLLITSVSIKDQIGLTGEERFLNADKNYLFNKDEAVNIKNKNILICDDVFTTGATLNACTKRLKENGANKVYFTTFAATINKKREV